MRRWSHRASDFPFYASVTWYGHTAFGRSADEPWNREMMHQSYHQSQTLPAPITLEQAKVIAGQHLASLSSPSLAIKEIMEFQYNFYIMYREKDTGIGAFEMLIWKQPPPTGMMGVGMGGNMMGNVIRAGEIVPESGPNMMWNTEYSMMQGIMGSRG